ncbi:hypothetical protein GCM10027456_79180 [Kineosporia babensis]
MRQPIPFLTVTEERAQRGDLTGLRGSFQRFAQTVLEPDGALDVVADVHPVERGDPGRAGLAGPVAWVPGFGMFGRDPPAHSQQGAAEVATNARGECGGVVPAIDPLFPDPGSATGPGILAAGALLRRIAEPEIGNGPLQRMESVELRPLQHAVLADAVEQIRIEILAVWAAIEEEHLAGDHRQQGVLGAAQLVSPGAENGADAGYLLVYSGTSEDPPGQG